MKLYEMWNQEPEGYHNVEDDNSVSQLGDLRKTKLTLRQINKLRSMNDLRNYEYKEKLKLVKKQYSQPAQAPGI